MTGDRHPLRRRLVWTVVALVLSAAAVLAVVSALVVRDTLYDQIDSQLTESSQRATSSYDGPGPGGDRPGDPPGGTHLAPGQAAGTVGVFYDDGVLVDAGYVDDDGDYRQLDEDQVAALGGLPVDGEIHDVDLPDLGSFRAIATTTDDGDPVVTAINTGDASDTLGAYVTLEIVLGSVAVAGSAVAATVLVRRALRPLDEVAGTARQVSELPLHQGEIAEFPRVRSDLVTEQTEVGQVGSAFNRMIDHVETALSARYESEQQVRRFVADASHELRTPLASIRGYAELVRRSPEPIPPDVLHALGRVEAESTRMSDLVDDLLLLARLDAGRPLEKSPVDLSTVVVDTVADAHAAGPDHRWRMDLGDPPTSLEVIGDEARLRQVVSNLLANARLHTPAGTTVMVTGRCEGADVVVTIADNGPGIATDVRETLFQRFTRADTARSRAGGSTGLGLAIVQAIVHAHGGSIAVDSRSESPEDTPTETGTTFTVRLPASTRQVTS